MYNLYVIIIIIICNNSAERKIRGDCLIGESSEQWSWIYLFVPCAFGDKSRSLMEASVSFTHLSKRTVICFVNTFAGCLNCAKLTTFKASLGRVSVTRCQLTSWRNITRRDSNVILPFLFRRWLVTSRGIFF